MSGSLHRRISVSAPDGINSIILHGLRTPTCARTLTQPFAPLAGARGLCHGSGALTGCAAAEQDTLPAPEDSHWGLHLEARLLSELNCEQPSFVPLQGGAREPGNQEQGKGISKLYDAW